MNFPELHDWKTTSWALHQASMLIGPIHNAVFSPRQNYLHLPMFVEPTGLVSQTLPQGGVIHINFEQAAVTYVRGSGGTETWAIEDHTQTSLFQSMLAALKTDELANFFSEGTGHDLIQEMMSILHSDTNRVEFLKLEDVTHTNPLQLNRATAADYAKVLYHIYTGVARFRARLNGHMTPMVVWPEHFDLSMLYFHPDNAEMDDHKAHLNFGFTPYTPGQYEFPYLYVYAYPYPEPFTPPHLPQPAFWHSEGWRGAVVSYETMREQAEPTPFIESVCEQLFGVLSKLINADRIV